MAQQRCSQLLRDPKFQNAKDLTAGGTKTRLDMIRQAGLAEMLVVPARTIETLGRIPRSTEGHAIKAVDAVIRHGGDGSNLSKAIIVFFSHRWKRPNWCEALGKNISFSTSEAAQALRSGHYIGDPDDAERTKARALINWAKWYRREISTMGTFGTPSGSYEGRDVTPDPDAELYFWIDWPCVDQQNPKANIEALPAYVATCHAICAAWNDEYASRAWCRVELLTAQAFMWNGYRIFICEEGFTFNTAHTVVKEDRSTWMYITKENVSLESLTPLDGMLTKEADRGDVKVLQDVAMQSSVFTCENVCYKTMCESAGAFCFMSCCLCCFCCGLGAAAAARSPGHGDIIKIFPRGGGISVMHSAPRNVTMQRAGSTSSALSPAQMQELMGLKQLLDRGVLTREEFDAEKKKRLGASVYA